MVSLQKWFLKAILTNFKQQIKVLNYIKCEIMATITLNYDARNVQTQKALDFILSLGLFQKKEKKIQLSRFEQSMLDIEQGNVFYINGPKK